MIGWVIVAEVVLEFGFALLEVRAARKRYAFLERVMQIAEEKGLIVARIHEDDA